MGKRLGWGKEGKNGAKKCGSSDQGKEKKKKGFLVMKGESGQEIRRREHSKGAPLNSQRDHREDSGKKKVKEVGKKGKDLKKKTTSAKKKRHLLHLKR